MKGASRRDRAKVEEHVASDRWVRPGERLTRAVIVERMRVVDERVEGGGDSDLLLMDRRHAPQARGRLHVEEEPDHVRDLELAVRRGMDAVPLDVARSTGRPDEPIARTRDNSIRPDVRPPEQHRRLHRTDVGIGVQERTTRHLLLDQSAHGEAGLVAQRFAARRVRVVAAVGAARDVAELELREDISQMPHDHAKVRLQGVGMKREARVRDGAFRFLEPRHLDLIGIEPGRGDLARNDAPVRLRRVLDEVGALSRVRAIDQDQTWIAPDAAVLLKLEGRELLCRVRHADRDPTDVAARRGIAGGVARDHARGGVHRERKVGRGRRVRSAGIEAEREAMMRRSGGIVERDASGTALRQAPRGREAGKNEQSEQRANDRASAMGNGQVVREHAGVLPCFGRRRGCASFEGRSAKAQVIEVPTMLRASSSGTNANLPLNL